MERCPDRLRSVNAKSVQNTVVSPLINHSTCVFFRFCDACSNKWSHPLWLSCRSDTKDMVGALSREAFAGFGPFRYRIYPQKCWECGGILLPKSQAQESAINFKKGRKRGLTGQGHPPINRFHEVTATCSSGGNEPTLRWRE